MLLHAPWGGRETVEGAHALDVFAGTGALGLEALSRGAAHATFIEHDRAALAALRANIAACRASDRCTILAIDALAVPPGDAAGLVFLDPPYRQRPGAACTGAIARRRPHRAWRAPDRGNGTCGAAAHIGTAARRTQSRRGTAQHLARLERLLYGCANPTTATASSSIRRLRSEVKPIPSSNSTHPPNSMMQAIMLPPNPAGHALPQPSACTTSDSGRRTAGRTGRSASRSASARSVHVVGHPSSACTSSSQRM